MTAVPDLVVSSASLWHLLWFTNATVFGEELGALGQAAGGYLAAVRWGLGPPLRSLRLLAGACRACCC